jgi:hypothetical protein
LVHKCLAAGTSAEGYCDRCSAPFVRVIETKGVHAPSDNGKTAERRAVGLRTAISGAGAERQTAETTTLGWRASCRCENPVPRPGRVLDPFCGSGRTGVMACRMGLDFTGVELNPEFAAMATRILRNDQPLFNEFE